MKKLGITLIVVGAVAALSPAVARATEPTTGEDSVGTTIAGVPEACIYYLEPPEDTTTTESSTTASLTTPPPTPPTFLFVYDPGPARNVHYTTPDYPDCEDVEGICVEVGYPTGPSRVAHRPQTEEEPCVPIDEACDISEVFDVGPARAVHQAPQRPMPYQQLIIDIPAECEEALSEALVPAGSDSGTIVFLAALFVGLGGAMVVTRRAIAIRTR
jgi:hypothetical protein